VKFNTVYLGHFKYIQIFLIALMYPNGNTAITEKFRA
jgi:hypothetical protein